MVDQLAARRRLNEGADPILDAYVAREGSKGVQVIVSPPRNAKIPVNRAHAAFDDACQKAGVDLSAFRPDSLTPAQAMGRVVQYRSCLGKKTKRAHHVYYEWTKVGDSFRMAEQGGSCTIQLTKFVVDEYAKRAVPSRAGEMTFRQGSGDKGYPFEVEFEGDVPPGLQDALKDAHHVYWGSFVPSDFTSVIKHAGLAFNAISLRETGGIYFFPAIGDALAVAEALSTWCRHSFNRSEVIRLKNYTSTSDAEAKENRNSILGGIKDEMESSLKTLADKVREVAENAGEGSIGRPSTFAKRVAEVEDAMDKASLYETLLDAKLDSHRKRLQTMKNAFAAYQAVAETE